MFHLLFIISAHILYGNCSRPMTSSFFYSSDDIFRHHCCVLLHHNHAIAHHSFIIRANGLFIDSLWSLYALYGIFYVYKDKQSFTYKYRVLYPGNISFLAPQSVITYCLASILNSIVSSVLSHWVLPHYAVVSAPFEKLRSRKGFRQCTLPMIGFVSEDGDSPAFGFLDPSLVIHGCYLIPAFADGHTAQLL